MIKTCTIIKVVNDCTRVKCLNNGICYLKNEKALCKCPIEFFGDYCQYCKYISKLTGRIDIKENVIEMIVYLTCDISIP